MNKRIMIFSPEQKERETIGSIVYDYMKKNFPSYKDILTQKFYSLYDANKGNELGHWGEVLVVFDRRICSKENRMRTLRPTPYFRALNASFELSKKLCDEKGIPYVIYKGEIIKKEIPQFMGRINSVKEKIKDRLEERLL